MMENQARFEGWAILELNGHNKEIGYVTTEYFGGPALFRVDQPELPEREYELTRAQWIDGVFAGPGTKMKRESLPGKTAYVGPHSIYRMNPCSEEIAQRAIEEMIPAPIKILHLVESKRLAEAVETVDSEDEFEPQF
jgi:hypothetical protein